MKLVATIRWFLPVAICAAMFSMSTLAGEGVKKTEKTPVPAEDSDSSRPEVATRQAPLRGSGLLIVDPHDSEDQIKIRLRSLFSFEGQDVIPSAQRQAEIAREVDALFAGDGAVSRELPEVSFEFRQKTSVALFRMSLLRSKLARQSDKVCPEDCSFRDLEEDSLHIHLTKPAGGPGDTVLVLKIQESYDLPGEAPLAGALSLRRDWLKRTAEDDVKPAGVRVFSLRVTLTDSEN